jgi:hypothetical protein
MTTESDSSPTNDSAAHPALSKPRRRPAGRRQTAAAPALCLLGTPLTYVAYHQLAVRPALRDAPVPHPSGPHSPSDAALREAVHHWTRALDVADRERYAVEGWDPAAARGDDPETWRLRLMARDRYGDLRQARIAAQRAASLAQTPEETYQAALWLTAIDHDSGHHAAELRNAQRLVALAPRRTTSLLWLHRAALCNGPAALARQADAALAKLPEAPHSGSSAPAPPGFEAAGRP